MAMEKVLMYLRKSRADLEDEARGEGETLTKHRNALLKIARDLNLNIVKIREEIVSGESLMHRPEMLELLKEVAAKEYDAVLVMDIDRLGRGNMQEQGLILETFKEAGVKIITPRKTYNLADEWDEEYSEFEAFMARKELKMINRRLQRGRIRSIEDGNYIAPYAPYGYEIHEEKGTRTLMPHPEQADIVKSIFNLYVYDNLGCTTIAKKLNELGYRSYTGNEWMNHSVINILKNVTYTGKLTWKKKDIKKSLDPNKVKDTRTRPRSEWIVVDGKHEGIIDTDTFERAQVIMKSRTNVPAPNNKKITNPLAGLLRCGNCGSNIVLRPYTKRESRIICYKYCGMISAKFYLVEAALIESLEDLLREYQLNEGKLNKTKKAAVSSWIYEKAVQQLEKELQELEKQKGNLHDLLERGIYTVETFLERSTNLVQRTEEVKINLHKASEDLNAERFRENAQNNIVPKLQKVLDAYHITKEPALKNRLLKTILEFAVYNRPEGSKEDEFTLKLSPKL